MGKEEQNKQSEKGKKKSKKKKQISASDFPRRTLEETLDVPKCIYENFAGNATPWDTIASFLEIGSKSPNLKYLIWSAEAYGIILQHDNKSYSISELGRKLIAPTYGGEDTEAARKAIMTPTIMSKFYTDYNKHPIPKDEFFPNILEHKYEIPRNRLDEAKTILMENARFADIVIVDDKSDSKIIVLDKDVSGKVSISPDLEKNGKGESEKIEDIQDEIETLEEAEEEKTTSEYSKTCFVISPIGEENSETRKHSDLLLKHLIEPVCEEYNLNVVRADKIDKSGLITQQILEHLAKSYLCIADLSYSNPNVFYELGVRHVCQLPTIQIIRKGDKIPFDVSQGRTIILDLSDIYTIIDRIESGRRELKDHLSSIKKNSGKEVSEDNPIKIYLPDLKVNLPK